HVLPNKFFESIMAGLAVIVGHSPEMKRIIEEFDCGFVANSFKIFDVSDLINELSSEDIMKKKKASLEAVRRLNAETKMKKFVRIVDKVFK
ncbi:glycosyltransferase, partial [candidate division WOR-3 bacterium]|nr:glycosyltransferase [candidate division WOR-3 bacterium]